MLTPTFIRYIRTPGRAKRMQVSLELEILGFKLPVNVNRKIVNWSVCNLQFHTFQEKADVRAVVRIFEFGGEFIRIESESSCSTKVFVHLI